MAPKRILFSMLAVLLCIILAFSNAKISQAEGEAGTKADPRVISLSEQQYDSGVIDTTNATVGSEDPEPSCSWGWMRTMTYWFTFKPQTDMIVRGSLNAGYNDYITISVLQADESGAITEINCTDNMSSLRTSLAANQTYYFMVSGQSWNPGGYGLPEAPWIQFKLWQVLPPANDNFANAEEITDLPFSPNPDFTAASVEDGEPKASCWGDFPDKSVWYKYTPPVNKTLTLSIRGSVAVYTGSGLDQLTEIGCGSWNEYGIQAQAGTTYYVQAALFSWSEVAGFTLDYAPPPYVSMDSYPDEPSIYDTMTFSVWAYDPANIGIETIQWNFGDGTTGEGYSANHTYAADGNYTVTFTVITYDGRSASGSRVMHISTHDVSITGFKTPEAIKAGQRHRFEVTVLNKRYTEAAWVQIYKVTPSGSTLFALLHQDVPVGKPVLFNLDYTFTKTDEVLGIKSFRAEVMIDNYRDAKIDDNSLTVDLKSGMSSRTDWTIYSGDWSVVNGKLTSLSYYQGWIWAGNPPLVTQGDFTAGFTMQLTDTDPSSWQRFAGVMFFASSPTILWNWDMNTYSMDYYPMYGDLMLCRWDQGNRNVLATVPVSQLPKLPQQWLIKVEGDMIRVYGDGALIFEVKDATYRSGHFGFWTYGSGTKMELSNIQIGKQFRTLWAK